MGAERRGEEMEGEGIRGMRGKSRTLQFHAVALQADCLLDANAFARVYLVH